MDENIMVSVIMPVFNHERYIEHAIESVLMQKVNFEYELLIGEDCSTDSSLEKIMKYKDYPQVKIFARERNMHKDRIPNGLDLMIRSKGKYMVMLEGDDYWSDENKLQRQVDFLEEHPDYICCAHKFHVVDENEVIYKDNDFECQCKEKNPYTIRDFEKGKMLSHISTLLYRNFFANKSIDYSFWLKIKEYTSDYTLTAMLLQHGKLYCIDEYMSCYRKVVNKNSTSFSSRQEQNNTRDLVYRSTQKVERALNKYGKISFGERKKSIFASAVFKWYRDTNVKNFKVVTNIIKMSGEYVRYTLWFMYLIVCRYVLDIIGKENIRVPF